MGKHWSGLALCQWHRVGYVRSQRWLEPGKWSFINLVAQLVGVAFALAGRVDDACDVAAAAQHEARVTIGQLRDAPSRLPGEDVVLLRADRVDVLANLPEIDGDPFQHDFARLDETVLQVGIAEVERVRRACHRRSSRAGRRRAAPCPTGSCSRRCSRSGRWPAAY